jgi:hypothetical protein
VQTVYGYARFAGFDPETARQMVAIAQRESSLNPNCMATSVLGSSEASYGLWQINMQGALGAARMIQFGLTSASQLLDPVTNAKAAYSLSSGGTDLTPWHIQSDTSVIPYRTRYLAFLNALPDSATLEAGYTGTPVDVSGSAGSAPTGTDTTTDPNAAAAGTTDYTTPALIAGGLILAWLLMR